MTESEVKKVVKTHPWAITAVILTTLFTSLGQFFWKKGADNLVFEIIPLLTNWNLILGFAFYGAGLVILVVALKFGELSVLYPFISLSFIWVSLLAIFLLNESMSLLNWAGILTIVAGVSLISWGAGR